MWPILLNQLSNWLRRLLKFKDILINDFVPVDRRDTTGNVGTYAGVQLYGTTANTSNVTQLTSRTTGVTINGAVGTITLFNAAGVATGTTFTVTNSFVSAQDVVLISQQSGTNQYQAVASSVGNGTFNITFNALVGVASDAPVFNFVVIKGALV